MSTQYLDKSLLEPTKEEDVLKPSSVIGGMPIYEGKSVFNFLFDGNIPFNKEVAQKKGEKWAKDNVIMTIAWPCTEKDIAEATKAGNKGIMVLSLKDKYGLY